MLIENEFCLGLGYLKEKCLGYSHSVSCNYAQLSKLFFLITV